jgi:hypothetical protein
VISLGKANVLNIIKQLKQQSLLAFNFALVGMIALFFAVTGLSLLGYGLIEQKQIAKQVGDLQITGRTIEAIVSSSKLVLGEEAAFNEFEKSVNSFNQQWTDFKQNHHYSAKTIEEVDVVWQRANSKAQMILSMKKEVMALREAFQYINRSLKPMHKLNEELVSILLSHNENSRQVFRAKELTILLLRVEKQIHFPFIGDENAVCACDSFDRESEEIADILNGFLVGNPNLGIEKIKYTKAREIIEKQITLYEKIHSHVNTIRQMTSEIFQVREAQAAIYRDSPELKSSLTKLNNHQLNKGLMVLVVCVWLAFFACMFGYIRALQTK